MAICSMWQGTGAQLGTVGLPRSNYGETPQGDYSGYQQNVLAVSGPKSFQFDANKFVSRRMFQQQSQVPVV